MTTSGVARAPDEPQPGFFLYRLKPGCWRVGAQITHDEERGWQATIDGIEKRPHEDPLLAEDVLRVWHYGRDSDETEYRYKVAMKSWAIEHAPDHPAANPQRPIDYRTLSLSMIF